MLNRKFFTYASLLALVAVPTVVEEVTLQQHPVYAEEVVVPKSEEPVAAGVEENGSATTPSPLSKLLNQLLQHQLTQAIRL